jgi:FkbM family methyltransferase
MKTLVKNLIVGTRAEPLARQVYSWISQTGRYDLQTLQVMDRVLGEQSSCVDVGCYKGDMLREMQRRAPRGRHFAFEPIPEKFAALVTRFPHVDLHNAALSDVAGEATFQHVQSEPALSGLKTRDCIVGKAVQEIRVQTVRLDDIVPDNVRIDFIKVDVEGAELQVFRGGQKTIRRCRPVIVFEHGLGGADAFGTTPGDMFDLLANECGLRLSLMRRWLRGEAALTREEFVAQFEGHKDFYYIAYPEGRWA